MRKTPAFFVSVLAAGVLLAGPATAFAAGHGTTAPHHTSRGAAAVALHTGSGPSALPSRLPGATSAP